MDSRKLEELTAEWVNEANESDLGLWWLADDLRDAIGPSASEEAICSTCIELLRPLLASGQLRAVDLLEGGKIEVWPPDTESSLERIRREWLKLGRKPTLGDVVWFIGTRKP